MRRLAASFALALGLIGMGLAALVWRGPEPGGVDDLYTLLFGPADLGPADPASVVRRSSPNDALACPPAACRGAVDLVAPIFAVEPDVLRAAALAALMAEPGAERVYAGTWSDEDRIVLRSRLMRYPDTVNLRVISLGEGQSSLLLYSRSQIGWSDMGVNRARLARVIERLTAGLPVAR
jgi:uncharacterized protein (DUF1499 family)